MSADLKTQIRDYAAGVDRLQEPISVDEIRLRIDRRDQPVVGLRSSAESSLERRPWPAVAAAAVILIIIAVFVFVFPGSEPPVADTLPDPMERDLGYYAPSDVPDGFVLQDMEASLTHPSVLFLRDVEGKWTPADGGFQISQPFVFPAGLPEDPGRYMDEIVQSTPGASRVVVDGRPAAIQETLYVDGPVTASLVRLAAADSEGGLFEIVASAMTASEVLTLAEDVERVPDGEFASLGAALDWELRVPDIHDSFEYEVPESIASHAADVDVVLGLDIFWSSSLARIDDGEATVITTDDGSIVDPESGPEGSRAVTLYLDVPDSDFDVAYGALQDRNARVSLPVSNRRIDRYVRSIGGGVPISEDPYVIQAPPITDAPIDVSELGQEVPLVPATSMDVVPDSLFGSRFGDRPAATEDRPVVVIGSARQPESNAPTVALVIWFPEIGAPCASVDDGRGMGSACGSELLFRDGVIGEGASGPFSELSYSVPFETSVVQFVTEDGSFWQRPIAGFGLIPYGDTVPRPTSIIAFDAAGDRIGEWEVPAN